MRGFPDKLIPENLAQFAQYKYERDVCYLREAIYEWMISKVPDEKSPTKPYEDTFDLETFKKTKTPPRFSEMVKTVCAEIEKVGKWNSQGSIFPKC